LHSNGKAVSMLGMAKVVPIPSPGQIKAIREKLGLKQSEAAEKVGVGQGVWSAWEKGSRKPSRQSAILIDLLRRKKI
jgi:DNA-binding transcriptional regulator YiaG